MNYQHAIDTLGSRKSKKIANNTYLEPREGNSVAVVLHGTDVVTYHPDGSVTLNSGGYETVTTKERINSFSPVKVFAKKREWFVNQSPEPIPFHDGMRVTAMGRVIA